MDTIRRPERLLPPPAPATCCWQPRRIASRILPFVLILAGIVRTPEKKPLALAKIRIVGTPFVAEADTDGAFRIRSPQLGSQTLEVKLLGYASILIPVRIEGGKTTTVDVILEVAPVPLETVKISGDTLIVPAMAGFFALVQLVWGAPDAQEIALVDTTVVDLHDFARILQSFGRPMTMAEVRDAVIKSGMEHGAAESYDKLAELLGSLAAPSWRAQRIRGRPRSRSRPTMALPSIISAMFSLAASPSPTSSPSASASRKDS